MRAMFQRYAPAIIGGLVGLVIVGALITIGQIRSTQVDHSPAVEHAASTQDVRQAFAAVVACVANLDHITYRTVYACELTALDHEGTP